MDEFLKDLDQWKNRSKETENSANAVKPEQLEQLEAKFTVQEEERERQIQEKFEAIKVIETTEGVMADHQAEK